MSQEYTDALVEYLVAQRKGRPMTLEQLQQKHPDLGPDAANIPADAQYLQLWSREFQAGIPGSEGIVHDYSREAGNLATAPR